MVRWVRWVWRVEMPRGVCGEDGVEAVLVCGVGGVRGRG